jgi:pimeloyl-ACP methyl ester carboxylesterase
VPTTTIDGITTHYEALGQGPPLLMFSPGGFDATLDKWSTLGVYARIKLLEHLSQRYTCIVFDRRETGLSGGRVEAITWAHYVAQGAGLLDHLGHAAAHLLGGCMGCCPVTAFAVRHPERVTSMILYWPVGGTEFRHRGEERFATHLDFVASAGLRGIVELAQSSDASSGKDPRLGPWAAVLRSDPRFAAGYARLDQTEYRRIVTGMLAALIDRDTAPGAEPEELRGVRIPALIVPGNDPVHATSAARFLAECLPHSDYWNLSPEEQTEANVPNRLLAFLDAAERTA